MAMLETEEQIEVREAVPADVPGIARVHVDSWRATYASLLPDSVLASLSYERRAEAWRIALERPLHDHCLFVAQTADGNIVGFANGGPERQGNLGFDGELYAIYLLRDHQGQGTGRRLFQEVAGQLAALGFRSLLVWVLDTNPARGFYERLGGQLVAEKQEIIGGGAVTEVAYGWPEIGPSLIP